MVLFYSSLYVCLLPGSHQKILTKTEHIRKKTLSTKITVIILKKKCTYLTCRMRWLSDGFFMSKTILIFCRSVCIFCLSLQCISTEQQAYPSPAGCYVVKTYCTHLATRYQLVCQEREISQYVSCPYLDKKKNDIFQAE